MKKTIALLLAFVLCLSLCACSGTKIEGTYEQRDGDYIVIDGEGLHRYEDSELEFTAEYSFKDGVLTFTYDDEEHTYWLRDDALINSDPIDNGLIPYTDTFDARCYSGDEWYQFEYNFYSDGTVNKYISLMGINNSSTDGVYKREGNLIKINWETGGSNYCYTVEGILYDSVFIRVDGK